MHNYGYFEFTVLLLILKQIGGYFQLIYEKLKTKSIENKKETNKLVVSTVTCNISGCEFLKNLFIKQK